MIEAHWQYLRYVVRHKVFVFQAGRKLGVPLLALIVHDWSKFLPGEWHPYVQKFYGKEAAEREAEATQRSNGMLYRPAVQWDQEAVDQAFDLAWNLHQKRQPHHWQFWCLVRDRGQLEALQMPERFLREMVADWIGAGRATQRQPGPPDSWAWYRGNTGLCLHPETRARVEALLADAVRLGIVLADVKEPHP